MFRWACLEIGNSSTIWQPRNENLEGHLEIIHTRLGRTAFSGQCRRCAYSHSCTHGKKISKKNGPSLTSEVQHHSTIDNNYIITKNRQKLSINYIQYTTIYFKYIQIRLQKSLTSKFTPGRGSASAQLRWSLRGLKPRVPWTSRFEICQEKRETNSRPFWDPKKRPKWWMLIDVDVWHFWVEKFKSDDDDSMHAYYIYIYVYLYINKICFFLNLQMNQKN